MKTRIGLIPVTLLMLSAGALAQTTKTTETKVGIGGGRGLEISRKHTTKTDPAPRSTARVKVNVDGDPVTFPDQGPIMRGGRVLVPLRGVFEKMGASVNWNRDDNTVTATGNGKTVVLPLGKTTATVDGKELTLDQPALVMRGRALVPLRFLSESLGATVDWRATDMTVAIKS